jgi:hypothetical protein
MITISHTSQCRNLYFFFSTFPKLRRDGGRRYLDKFLKTQKRYHIGKKGVNLSKK